jgi:hypothetical protein
LSPTRASAFPSATVTTITEGTVFFIRNQDFIVDVPIGPPAERVALIRRGVSKIG